MEIRKIVIAGTEILPGAADEIRIPAGRLPSGELMRIHLRTYRSLEEGPVVFLLAGVHGDEICGIEILRRFLEEDTFSGLARGTVLVMPLINMYGFLTFSRDLPDGKDINRSFPGNMSGSLASRFARVISKHILPVMDIAVDFHTGGASRYNFPQIRVGRNINTALALAESFAPPFIVTN